MDYEVTDFLRQDELLAMLAEECAELAQAALKLRRVLDDTNPTPISYQTAAKNFNEEVADVLLCLDQLHFQDYALIERIQQSKTQRWIQRLLDKRRQEDAQKSGRRKHG